MGILKLDSSYQGKKKSHNAQYSNLLVIYERISKVCQASSEKHNL